MMPFDSSKCCKSLNSGETLEKKLVDTEKYALLQQNFIEFQNWSSANNSVVLGDKQGCRDIPSKTDFSRDELFDQETLDDELAQLFVMSELFINDEELDNELKQLEEYLAESATSLVACPANMPRWENAWWGERALRELG